MKKYINKRGKVRYQPIDQDGRTFWWGECGRWSYFGGRPRLYRLKDAERIARRRNRRLNGVFVPYLEEGNNE